MGRGAGGSAFLPRESLGDLIRSLQERGYMVVGPTVRGETVLLRPLDGVGALPRGKKDVQGPGHYRLHESGEDLFFQCTGSPDSPKRSFFPPRQPLFRFHTEAEGFAYDETGLEAPRLALVGVRACDVAAVLIQDRVFGASPDLAVSRCEADRYYGQARRGAFLVAVNCTEPGATCFCASMETGPCAREGFDLAMTELRSGFVVESGSQAGEELLGELPVLPVSPAEQELADLKLQRACEHMGRRLETEGLVEMLDRTIEHPRWDQVARRCLSCGNCTLVCPTCFCSTASEASGLETGSFARDLSWESCYTHEFSYLTTGPHRNTIRGRYRHWLRHKLGTWWEQFGTSGCVGCGRCITWCPVGIDITEEAAALRLGEGKAEPRAGSSF
ncbi:MAG: 4Fe-4S dicluster domain-containing protein [bacterium]